MRRVLTCAGCGVWHQLSESEALRPDADRTLGWCIRAGRTYCPRCSALGVPSLSWFGAAVGQAGGPVRRGEGPGRPAGGA